MSWLDDDYTAIDQEDADLGAAMQEARDNNVFTAPPAEEAASTDWGNVFLTGTRAVTQIANAAGSIIGARDQAVIAREQSNLTRQQSAQAFDLAKYKMGANSALEKLKADSLVAQAKQQYQRIIAAPAAASSLFTMALIGGGIYLLVHKAGK